MSTAVDFPVRYLPPVTWTVTHLVRRRHTDVMRAIAAMHQRIERNARAQGTRPGWAADREYHSLNENGLALFQ